MRTQRTVFALLEACEDEQEQLKPSTRDNTAERPSHRGALCYQGFLRRSRAGSTDANSIEFSTLTIYMTDQDTAV